MRRLPVNAIRPIVKEAIGTRPDLIMVSEIVIGDLIRWFRDNSLNHCPRCDVEYKNEWIQFGVKLVCPKCGWSEEYKL